VTEFSLNRVAARPGESFNAQGLILTWHCSSMVDTVRVHRIFGTRALVALVGGARDVLVDIEHWQYCAEDGR
jgi:hypothetical protein